VLRYPGDVPLRLLSIQSVCLALLCTWPAVLHPGSAVLGSPRGDALKHVWNLWWMHRELWSGEWGLHTSLVNFPNGVDLYPIEVANGLLTAWWPIPPVPAANLLAIVHVTLVGVCTGWLGWLVTEERRGALVAGAMAQASAFTAFTLHAGVGELRQAWWLPLGMAFALRAHRSRAIRHSVQLGVVLALATLACFYHGFFLATSVAVYALCVSRLDRQLWAGWAAAALAALAIVVPTVKLFTGTYGPADARPAGGFVAWMLGGFPKDSYPVTSLRLTELFTPDLTLGGDTSAPLEAYLGGRYLGLVALALTAVGVHALGRRALPFLAISAVGVVLAFGNVTWWGGEGGVPLLMPLAVLNRALGWFAQPLNFPVRYLAITTTAIAVLVGAAGRHRWALGLVPIAMVDIVVNDRVSFPRCTFPLEYSRTLVAPEGAVADLTTALEADAGLDQESPLSLFDAGQRKGNIIAQISLDRPMQTLPIERVDQWATDGLEWTSANALARVAFGSAVDAEEVQAHRWMMWQRGFRSVILTHDCNGKGQLDALARLDEILGEHLEGDCANLWVLTEPPEPADPARWEAAYTAAMARFPGNGSGPPRVTDGAGLPAADPEPGTGAASPPR
jgi:hypothetical protein